MKRQANALTAVLENWQDVENAIDIYANSAGSALRENEIYLDSWEAKSKAVSAAWNELVNSLLDSNWIKGFLDGAQNVLSWLTNTNALIPVLAGLIGGVLTLAIQGLVKWIQGLKVALTEVNLLAGGIPLLIGLITTLAVGVVTWGINASDTAKQIENLTNKIEEQQKAIDDLNAKEKEATDLYKEYASLMSKSNAYGLSTEEKENLLKISNDLVDTYGLEVEGIDAVTGAYKIGTDAINSYVDALRNERIEKLGQQKEARNDRIDKNIDKIKDAKKKNINEGLEFSEKFWVSGNWAQAERKNEELLELIGINEKRPWYIKASDGFYGDKLEENYDTLLENYEKVMASDVLSDEEKARLEKWANAYRSEGAKISSEISSTINSVVKDLIANVQFDNADMLDSNSESLLTQMLMPYLSSDSIDWDKFDKADFESKVKTFVDGSSQTLSNLAMQNDAISKRISSDGVTLSDYQSLIENQTKQLGGMKEMFGENSDAAKEFQKNMESTAKSNVGMMFADISNDMKDAKIDTTKFDSLATSILRLDTSMSNGKITFSQYIAELNKQIDGISLENTFHGDTEAANGFFSILTTKGKNSVQNLAAQMQKSAISQKEYIEGLSDIASYFAKLGDKAESLPGIDEGTVNTINKYSSEIDGLISQIEKYSALIEKMPTTWDDFQKAGKAGVNTLIKSFKDAGITAEDLGYTAGTSIDTIVGKMWSGKEDFDKVQEAMKTKFKTTLKQMGVAIANLINELTRQFGSVKFTIKAPEGGWWNALKKAIKGEDLSVGLGVETDIDPEAFGDTIANALGDLNFGSGFTSFNGGGNPPPKTPPSGGDKDKNKPDYEDPTDAIINRINLRAKELEQQEEEIQNLIEIAELENDYKKQISLTNDLIAKRKDRLTELETANAGLHNEAEYLRNINPWDEATWFDSQGNATEAYNTLYNSSSKEEQEAIKDLFEKLSKYKKAYAENAEEITELNKEILQDEENIWDLRREEFDARLEESEYYIEHSNDFGWENGDNEIKARKRVLDWIQSDYYRSLIKDDEEYYKILEENRLKYNESLKEMTDDLLNELQTKLDESYDIRISRLNSESSLLSSHFGIVNAIAEEQHNLNKELLEAETIGARMNEQERESLFTKEEHTRLSGKLSDIMLDITDLQHDYMRDLENATSDTIEEVTNHYERQYELKMREYEIVKAELSLAKAQQVLENTENEKSVRTWNGSNWVYEANLQDVIKAQEDVENARYEFARAKAEEAQQVALNAIDSRADALETEKNKLATAIDEMAEKMSSSGKDITDMLKTIAETDLPTFDAIIQSMGDSIKEALNISDKDINKYRSDSVVIAAMKARSEAWHTASDSERTALADANARDGEKLGLTRDASGVWRNKDGSRAYASGTSNAKKGVGLFDEEGFGSEVILTNNGILTQFNGGERVFSPEMADRLWEMAQQNYNFAPMITHPDMGKLIPIEDKINNAISNISNAFGDTYMVNGVQLNESEGGTLKGFMDYLKKKV